MQGASEKKYISRRLKDITPLSHVGGSIYELSAGYDWQPMNCAVADITDDDGHHHDML